jgi:hypothetical protein
MRKEHRQYVVLFRQGFEVMFTMLNIVNVLPAIKTFKHIWASNLIHPHV